MIKIKIKEILAYADISGGCLWTQRIGNLRTVDMAGGIRRDKEKFSPTSTLIRCIRDKTHSISNTSTIDHTDIARTKIKIGSTRTSLRRYTKRSSRVYNQVTVQLTSKIRLIKSKRSSTGTGINTAGDGTCGIGNERTVYYAFVNVGIESEMLNTGTLVWVALDWYCLGDGLTVYGVAEWAYCCSAVVVAICL